MIKAKPLLSIIGLTLVLAMTHCSRSNSNAGSVTEKTTHPAADTTVQQDKTVQQTQKLKENISQADNHAQIEFITISPLNPTRNATISVSVKTNPVELPDMEIQYILWVNAAIAQKGRENIFSLATFKKNDFFYVDAVLMKDDREINRKRSEMVKIVNSSPEIKNVDLPEIKGPGTYTIKINAIDADSDPLRYSLEGEMLPAGITIDATGLAKISFTDKSPENIVFWVVVKDNEEGEVKQELKFNFVKELIRNKLNPEVSK
jgi:hypothetical protein